MNFYSIRLPQAGNNVYGFRFSSKRIRKELRLGTPMAWFDETIHDIAPFDDISRFPIRADIQIDDRWNVHWHHVEPMSAMAWFYRENHCVEIAVYLCRVLPARDVVMGNVFAPKLEIELQKIGSPRVFDLSRLSVRPAVFFVRTEVADSVDEQSPDQETRTDSMQQALLEREYRLSFASAFFEQAARYSKKYAARWNMARQLRLASDLEKRRN